MLPVFIYLFCSDVSQRFSSISSVCLYILIQLLFIAKIIIIFQMFERSISAQYLSPERVRTVRVLVKHLHSFSAIKHFSDTVIPSSSLRKYSRQLLCSRGYYYVKHLVTTWPLDASFRLVMELWLSLIQPWRYVNNCISREM